MKKKAEDNKGQKNNNPYEKWARIITKAWEDETFKKRLLKNPEQVMKENGIDVPAGMHFQVIEDTAEKRNLVLPLKPKHVLSEADLKNLYAASGGGPLGWNMPPHH